MHIHLGHLIDRIGAIAGVVLSIIAIIKPKKSK